MQLAVAVSVLQVGWGVVPVEAIMCYLLLGIDEIAIQMEEPFGEPPGPVTYSWYYACVFVVEGALEMG